MKIILTGGGTGGHIYPAIAIAQYFAKHQKECQILFVGTPEGMEVKMVEDAGFDYKSIEVVGFDHSFSLKSISHNLKAFSIFMKSLKAAKQIIADYEPDVVIGTGGYVSAPIVYTATKMKVRTAIHEQNAYPGATTRFLSSKVDIVLSAVAEARPRLKKVRQFAVVGNPIRESILMKSREQARRELGVGDNMFVFSFGGSLGADKINVICADLMEWNAKAKRFNYIHGYGQLGKEKFPELIKQRGVDLNESIHMQAFEYIDNMDTCLAAADLVICRAGAITISELQAVGKASILVPSPNVTANHQYHNAVVLEKKGACMLVEEKTYSKNGFLAMVEALCNDKEKIKAISTKSASLAVLDSASRIYKNVLKITN